MSKKTHDDRLAFEAGIIANAVSYRVHLFLGRGQYDRADANTLDEAIALGAAMKAAHPESHAQPLFYAIEPSGHSTVINPAPTQQEQTMKTTTTPEQRRKAKAAKGAKAAAKAPRAAKGGNGAKAPSGKRAAILAAAESGKLPPAPDFSAATHTRFRPKLEAVVAMVKAGDLRGLEAFEINPVSSSPKAIDKYRNLAVIALKARAAKQASFESR